MKIKFFILLFFTSIFYFSGCDSFENSSGDLFEGIVEYDITYVATDSNNTMLEVMPSQMICYYKDDKTKLTMSGAMGLFKLSVVTSLKQQNSVQMVKILNKKMKHTSLSKEEIEKFLEKEFKVLEIKKSGKSRNIAGLNADEFVLKINDGTERELLFYSADSLKFDKPYWCSPFPEVDNILLEYYFSKYDIKMKLTASKIIRRKLADAEFEIPEDYNEVSQEELDEMLQKFKI